MLVPMMNLLQVLVEGKPARKTLEVEGCWCGPLGIQLDDGCLKRCCVSQAEELEHTSDYTAQLDCNRLGIAVAGADSVSGSCAGMS